MQNTCTKMYQINSKYRKTCRNTKIKLASTHLQATARFCPSPLPCASCQPYCYICQCLRFATVHHRWLWPLVPDIEAYWGLCFWQCYNCYDLMWFDSCLILYDSEEVCHALLHVRCPNDTGQLVCDKSEFCQIRIAVTCHNDSERSTVRQLMNWWHVLRFTILAMAVAGWGTLLCVHASVARLLGHVCLLAFSLHSTLYYYMSQNIIYKFPCMSTLLTLCCWIVPCFLRSIFK